MSPDQVLAYKKYHDIVIIDTISKTNQFDMMLLSWQKRRTETSLVFQDSKRIAQIQITYTLKAFNKINSRKYFIDSRYNKSTRQLFLARCLKKNDQYFFLAKY